MGVLLAMCYHKFCIPFLMTKSGVMVIVEVVDQDGDAAILLGRARWGNKAGQLGACTGKLDPTDRLCHLACARRELAEEFKIHVTLEQFIQRVTHIERFDGCPLYVYRDDTINLDHLNLQVIKAYKEQPPSCQTELTELAVRKISSFMDESKCTDVMHFTRNAVNSVFNSSKIPCDRKIFFTSVDHIKYAHTREIVFLSSYGGRMATVLA